MCYKESIDIFNVLLKQNTYLKFGYLKATFIEENVGSSNFVSMLPEIEDGEIM